jgi:Fe2+ transport system protein FeoA
MILNNDTAETCLLGQLQPGDCAEIVSFDFDGVHEDYFRRLLEIGFLVGARLELLNEAPVSRNPVSIKVKDATYALRREEANCISVRRLKTTA